MTEFREIIAAKWEDNRIVGFELDISTAGPSEKRYVSLQEIHDEQIKIHSEVSVGVRDKADTPILILKYFRSETGGEISHPVRIVKIGNQYEVRLNPKNDQIPEALLELPKF